MSDDAWTIKFAMRQLRAMALELSECSDAVEALAITRRIFGMQQTLKGALRRQQSTISA